MANVVVIGTQWGDEGKGKIVDWLSEQADFIVRFQGGHNAGHTLVVGSQTYKLSLLPSGILWPQKTVLLGNGLVLDPYHLRAEMTQLRSAGVTLTPENVKISEKVPLLLSIHRQLDAHRETAHQGLHQLGTTQRGVGPAYEDKIGRRALQLIDLADPKTLPTKIDRLLAHHNPLRCGLGLPPYEPQILLQELHAITPDILPFMACLPQILREAQKEGKRILFEGAQGALLDIDHGTYPFVTSSNTFAANAALGTGGNIQMLHYILGVAKAYTTRVGTGPFPTELHESVGAHLAEKGKEFGTITGRKRRCGWIDAVALREIVQMNGIRGLVLTKLDVLDGLLEIKICTGYKLKDKEIDYLPAGLAQLEALEPVYETLEGWKEGGLQGVRSFQALPPQARHYVKRIETLIGIPIILLSTSPERNDTILLTNPFEDKNAV